MLCVFTCVVASVDVCDTYVKTNTMHGYTLKPVNTLEQRNLTRTQGLIYAYRCEQRCAWSA